MHRVPRRTCTFLAIAALGSLFPEGNVRAQDGPPVAGITVSGQMNVEEARIRSVIQSKVGQPFSEPRMEADRKAILGLGFFRSVTATRQPAGNRVTLTFQVNEWPKVTHIRVSGNSAVEKAELHAMLKTQRGQLLSTRTLAEDIRAIEELYRKRGYVAHVSESILDEAIRTGILRFEIVELAIHRVTVEGGGGAQRRAAEELLEEIPTKLYRPTDVAQDQQRLLKIKGVRSADARVEQLEPGKVHIRWVLNGPAKSQ